MKKLTAEVARRNIHLLKEMQSAPNIGSSMRSELFLQALEIALPILEQQERGEGGWIEWEGGEQPVADDVAVKVTCRGGDRFGPDSASCFEWEHYFPGPDGYDIIAYRIIPERANKATLTDDKREWLIDECKADMQRYTSNSPRYLVAQIALASLEACCIIPEQPTNQNGEQ